MGEPDWQDKAAVRRWLEERYPVANIETGSPFFQYLIDEQSAGKSVRWGEVHLSPGVGGEFRRWRYTHRKQSSWRYQGADFMRTTYYDDPEYFDEKEKAIRQWNPPVIEPIEGAKNSKTAEKMRRAQQAAKDPGQKSKGRPKTRKLSQGEKSPRPEIKERPRTRNPKTKQRESGQLIDKETSESQKDRLKTLRPRRNYRRSKTGRCGSLRSDDLTDTPVIQNFSIQIRQVGERHLHDGLTGSFEIYLPRIDNAPSEAQGQSADQHENQIKTFKANIVSR